MRRSLALLALLLSGALTRPEVAAAQSAHARSLVARGDHAMAQGLSPSARSYYREAISASPNFAEAYEKLARAYLGENRLNDAADVARIGREHASRDVSLMRVSAAIFARLGEPLRALELARRAQAFAPQDLEVIAERRDLALSAGAWSEALACTRRLLALHEEGRRTQGPTLGEEALSRTRALLPALRTLASALDLLADCEASEVAAMLCARERS